jgi:acetylornithine/succinyldiaminopimelate/putrescine aminotransferase
MLINFYNTPKQKFVRGNGVWLWDENNEKYFDGINGVGSNIFGHCDTELTEVVSSQCNTLWQVSNQLQEDQRERLANRLCKLTGMDSVFFHSSGSEAVDLAIKITKWNRPGSIVVINKGFHGTTFSGTLLTRWPGTYENFNSDTIDVISINDDIEELNKLKDKNISAIIIEPILGMGGARMLDTQFLLKLYMWAKQSGIIVIADECQCGFYRCGGISIMQDLDLAPDILILSKGLANGMPLSACFISSKLKTQRHGTTYGGNALSCAVSNRILDKLQKIDLNLQRKIVEQKINSIKKLSKIKQIRCLGHMIGIDVNCDVNLAWSSCLEQKLLVIKTLNNTLRLMLPLNITDNELNLLTEKITEALK